MPNGHNLPHLHVRSPSIDVPSFHKILAQCPLLERLSINHGYWNIVTETWTILAKHCPLLRDLQVWNGHMVADLQLPDFTALLYLFPKLETLCLNVVQFPEMLDPFDLKGCRQRYEDTYGVQEPPLLKSLSTKGPNNRAFIILMYALTAFPVLESLTIGSTHTLRKSTIQDVPSVPPGEFTAAWGARKVWLGRRDADCFPKRGDLAPALWSYW
ncbi:hypothetical protein BGZ47_003284 [Haplosporangium gracile]|nr:hypothetical protein BGZ47_003284 [Haplosporangium gracile]